MNRHIDWQLLLKYFMKYLFTLTANYYNTLVQYRISQIGHNEYYAECTDKKIEKFTLKKCSGVWISQGGLVQLQAAQIGENIDKVYLRAINN
jgi:hypothetical protein